MSGPSYNGLGPSPSSRDIVTVVNQLLQGKLNVVTSLTLAAGATSTTLENPRIGANSAILLAPRSSNAAGALATTYVSAKTKGSAVFTHVNAASTDRAFDVVILG